MNFIVKLLVRIAPMHFLIASIEAMGWGISVETDKEMVEGLVIGDDDFIERHIPKEVK